ncbi:MAG: MmgE/PrpD family protein [Chloroflexi bacterium]|nr:MmgE/PrpD family protein [Chloroflexota bacterium]
MSYTEQLADYFAALRLEDVPSSIREFTKLTLLDTLGVLVAGVRAARQSGDELVDRYVAAADERPEATVIGAGMRSSARVAAFANGCRIELLDWQDTIFISRVHSCSGVVPATLAVAERDGLSGADLLLGMIVGYEAGARVGQAVHPTHWRRGFQSTGTLNTLGVAAGVGRMWGFDARTMANALGTAGHIVPISNGDGVFCGYSIKVIHGGEAAQAGIHAAELARAGFAAGPLEGLPPRYAAFIPMTTEAPRPEKMVEDLGSHWYLNDVWHKPYPTGLLNIGPAEAAMSLATEFDIRPADVESIDVGIYRDGVHFTGRHYTTTESTIADCQLSLPYTVAVALADRKLGPDQMLPKRVADPAVHELASRVTVREDPEMEAQYPQRLAQTMTVRLKDGRQVTRRIDRSLGSPERRMTEADITAKFLGEAEQWLGTDEARRAVDLILDVERLDRIDGLAAALAGQGISLPADR